jgi:peroxiredoxin
MRNWLKIGLLVLLAGVAALWLSPSPDGDRGAAVGGMAPGFALPDVEGGKVSLDALRGRAVVINFWATWCPPCKEELPELAASWRASRGRCVEFVGITEESSREEARAELARHGVAYPVVIDADAAVARAFGVTGFPRTYLVDAEGRIRKVFSGKISRERLEAALLPLVPPSCPGI